jgi:hypothetical protein
MAMAEKNIAGMEKYLHPDVHFISPLAEKDGKAAYLDAAKNLMSFFKTLTIRTTFGSDDQAMVVYDFDFPAPIGHVRTAGLMTFQDGLITKIELFFDARPFEKN